MFVAPTRSLLAAVLLVVGGIAAGTAHTPAGASAPQAGVGAAQEARAGVEAMLARGADAWNRGDLDAFMRDYVPGTRTTYIGRNGIVRGPAAIRASYAPRFRPGVERGTLRFEDVEVDVLAPGVANAIATYVLTVGDSTIGRGPTSLVVVRQGRTWRILHDHSS